MTFGRRPSVWSRQARTDLDAIWDYYAQVAGREVADNLVRGIVHAVSTLDNHPLAGRSRDDLRQGLRSIAVTPYVVFYRVEDNVPQIARVLDGRRNIGEILYDE
jgi:toxin ParE1/3/4